MFEGISEGLVTGGPGDVVPMAADFDLGGLSEWHREVAGQMNAVRVVADVHGKRLHQVLAVVAVVERAGAEKERERRVDARLRQIVPGDPDAAAPKAERMVARHGKGEQPEQGWLVD